MSVQTEIDRIITAIGNAYDAIGAKGGTVPADETVANLGEAIRSIPAGAAEPVLQEKSVTPSTAAQEVTPDSGYDGLSKVNVGAMPTATQATPSITVSSSGLITASATQGAGYVASGTKSATKQMPTQPAKTITPGTADQTAVSAGRYTTGAVTVKGDANLVAGNIKSGVSIFGVAGAYEGSSGGGSGGGSSQGGFSVTFPAAGSNNYANWSKFTVAYILKADGTILNITDYTVVAGKTIDGVVLFTAGGSGNYLGLRFAFKGKVTLYRPSVAYQAPAYVCRTFNDTTASNIMDATVFSSQFFIPNSDLTITSISAYYTD